MDINQPKKYSRFRNKVVSILLLIGIAPLLIVAIISLAAVIETRARNISELQLQALEAASEKVKSYLEQRTDVFNLVIDRKATNISEVGNENLQSLIENLRNEVENIKEITLVNIYGIEIVKRSEIQNVGDLNLKNIYERDISQREDFKVAITGKDYFGPVYYTLDGPIMRVSSQIEDKERDPERPIGIITAEVGLKPIKDIILQMGVGEEGFIYLVDSRGNLIASSNLNFAQQGENLSYIPLVADVISGKTHNGLSKQDRYTNTLGQQVIFAGMPVGMSDWSIILEWPRQDAFKVVATVINYFIIILVVSLVLIVFFSWFFARLVVKPVESLSRGADEMGKGNFNYQVDIQTGDELEKLGERFNKMRKVLKENQRLRDEFVFISAHELRAPVTVIEGYLSMIMSGDGGVVPEEMQKLLKPVIQSGQSLNQLVNDLLQVARSEAGKIEVKVQPVDIVLQTNDVLNQLKVLADEKSIKLVYEPSANLPKVLSDEAKLQEIIKNLVSNSIKYTLGSGTVAVEHQIKDKMLITHVKDTGLGISKEDQKKLFQKFYRIKTKDTEKIQGTGLGLWIIKQLLEKMKGNIWVVSEAGKGSTFSFSLPIAGNKT